MLGVIRAKVSERRGIRRRDWVKKQTDALFGRPFAVGCAIAQGLSFGTGAMEVILRERFTEVDELMHILRRERRGMASVALALRLFGVAHHKIGDVVAVAVINFEAGGLRGVACQGRRRVEVHSYVHTVMEREVVLPRLLLHVVDDSVAFHL